MRWLHLTDLHVKAENESQAVALRGLVKAVLSSVDASAFNAILVTGDVAYSGQQKEYEAFSQLVLNPLLDSEQFRNARVVIVPGNHDLDVDVGTPLSWDRLGRKRQEQFFENTTRATHLREQRAKGFTEFSDLLMISEQISGTNPLIEPGAIVEIDSRSGTYHFACLTTAFFSDTEVSDKGIAPAPTLALRRLCEAIPEGERIITLGHHPVSHFREDSRSAFQAFLQERGAIYLHGHTHELQAEFGPNGLWSLGFGANNIRTLDDATVSIHTNMFAVCEVADALHIANYSWDQKSGRWVPETRVPVDFTAESQILRRGYRLNVPFCPPITETFTKGSRSPQTLQHKPALDRPLWLDPEPKVGWAELLSHVPDVPDFKEIDLREIGAISGPSSHRTFVASDGQHPHLIHAISANNDVVTYDLIEKANTVLDAEGLASCLVITLGFVSDEAADLAHKLGAHKRLTLIDGEQLKLKIATLPAVRELSAKQRGSNSPFSIVPILTSKGMGYIVRETATSAWFTVIGPDGNIVPSNDDLVIACKERRPELQRSTYHQSISGVHDTTAQSSHRFDRTKYLHTCSKLFNDVSYAGFANIGIALPTDSLRDLYVPPSAEVSESSISQYAYQQVVEEQLDALKLDARIRDQIETQLKQTRELRRGLEADLARRLYHQYGNIAVVGDPGSGKTCFAKYEMLTYCIPPESEVAWYEKHIPVYLPLSDGAHLLDDSSTLIDLCARYAEIQNLGLSTQDITNLLAEGSIAFFFDGLDEVASIEKRQRLMQLITDTIEKCSKFGNRFVVTLRPAALRTIELPEDLRTLQLRGLADPEIEALATRVIVAGHDGEDNEPLSQDDRAVLERLLADCKQKPGIDRLARNPLLLTLLVMIYTNSGPFSAKRHTIYAQAARTLISVRHRDARPHLLSEQDLRARLGLIALSIYRQKISDVPSRNEIRKVLSEIFVPQGHEPNNAIERVDRFLQDVAEITGILRLTSRSSDDGEDAVTFMHHSFLEYYAGIGLDQSGQFDEEINDIALQPRWHDVITLAVGIKNERGDITPTLKAINRSTDSLEMITGSRLLMSLDCALECDVPPESAQQYLSTLIKQCIKQGAAKVVSELRDELSKRISDLLNVSGSIEIVQALSSLVENPQPTVAAAALDLISRFDSALLQRDEVSGLIRNALHREEQIVRISGINAVANLPIAADGHLQVVVQTALKRGSAPEKLAAMELLEKLEGLVPSVSTEILDLLSSPTPIVSATAAALVLKTGLYRTAGFRSQTALDKALTRFIHYSGPRSSLGGRVSVDSVEIEALIASTEVEERIRGVRLLALLDTDLTGVHRILARILSKEEDHQVLSLALSVLLVQSSIIRRLTLKEIDQICKLLKHRHGDVRVNAGRVLHDAPKVDIVSSALGNRYLELKHEGNEEELSELLWAITEHTTPRSSLEKLVIEELNELFGSSHKRWSKGLRARVVRFMSAVERISSEKSSRFATTVINVATDYRVPIDVRRATAGAFGGIAVPSEGTMRRCLKLVRDAKREVRRAGVRAAGRLVLRSSARIQAVRDISPVLSDVQGALERIWTGEYGAADTVIDSGMFREVRNALLQIESLRATYNEHSARGELYGQRSSRLS